MSPEPGPGEAGPFSADGGPVGVLVLHGFTGSPQTVRPWAERLAEAGLTVRAPLLSGHGGDWRTLAKTGWQDWYADAERAFTELYARCDRVFVAGISMGGCLAFRLAETQGDRISGLVVVNPSLAGDNRLIPFTPVLKYVVRAIPSIGGDIKNPGAQEGAAKKTPVASVSTLPAIHPRSAEAVEAVSGPPPCTG